MKLKKEIILTLYLPFTYLLLTFYIFILRNFYVSNNYFLTFYLNLKDLKEYRIRNKYFLNKKLIYYSKIMFIEYNLQLIITYFLNLTI